MNITIQFFFYLCKPFISIYFGFKDNDRGVILSGGENKRLENIKTIILYSFINIPNIIQCYNNILLLFNVRGTLHVLTIIAFLLKFGSRIFLPTMYSIKHFFLHKAFD